MSELVLTCISKLKVHPSIPILWNFKSKNVLNRGHKTPCKDVNIHRIRKRSIWNGGNEIGEDIA
jgi:hypothetical protein